MRRIILLVAISLTIAVCVMLTTQPTTHSGVTSSGQAQIGGHFTLTDINGRRVADTDFRGKYLLVYMGYSHCPDICPATLSILGGVLRQLEANANKISVVFITLDAVQDTPSVLAKYLRQFDSGIIGLTGTAQEVLTVAHEYKAYFAHQSQQPKPGDNVIQHSGYLYLMGPDGAFIRLFESGTQADAIVTELKQLLQR